MKKMKRLVAITMAAVMTLAIGSMAFAAETTASTDTGTITINGLEEGVTVTAYKIAEAEYDASTDQFSGYKMLYTAGGFSIDPYGNYDEEALTEENMAALFQAAQGAETSSRTADSTGVATFDNLPVGAYLFVVSGSESTVYGMVIGSVSYGIGANTGDWTVINGEVDVKGDNLWVKASAPTIEKTETGGDLKDFEHGGSVDVGDTLEYHITVSPIPQYEGAYPEFVVTDKIDSRLQITEEEFAAMTILIGDVTLVSGTDYIATKTADGFTVDFVVDGVYTLNAYVGQSLLIDFCADVISAGDADADDADHENDATLTFATTSYMEGNEGTVDDTDHDYSFNVKIQKTDGTQALSGAEFTLYTDEGCTEKYTQTDVTDAGVKVSAADGYFEFTGLEAGTYYMKETKAPYGYALNTNIYKIVISDTLDQDGILTDYTIFVYDTTNDDELVGSAVVSNSTAQIVNAKVGELPSTGGRGTLLFTIIGGAIVVCAVVGVVAIRRRRAA